MIMSVILRAIVLIIKDTDIFHEEIRFSLFLFYPNFLRALICKGALVDKVLTKKSEKVWNFIAMKSSKLLMK